MWCPNIELDFERDFETFLVNRMYPPSYEKETVMNKPERKHVAAITRSIHLLENGLKDDLEKDFHKGIERDLNLLKEVKDMLFDIMANPTLPFVITQPDSAQPILDQIENAPN